jgi:hypothetical protein
MVNKRTNLATVLLSVSVLEVRTIGCTPRLACDNDRNTSLMYKGRLNMDCGALEYESLLTYQSQNQELRTKLQKFTLFCESMASLTRVCFGHLMIELVPRLIFWKHRR